MTEAPVLLLTTVDIGDGRHDTICIHEGDHPEWASLCGLKQTAQEPAWDTSPPAGPSYSDGDADVRRYAGANPTTSTSGATELPSRNSRDNPYSGGFANSGDRLYMEGMLHRRRKQELADHVHAARLAAEMEGLTFQPQISNAATKLKRPTSAAPWLRLSRTLSERSQLRMEALRTEAEAKKTEGCTFKPKVNPSSVRMVLEKQALQGDECISRYDKLYTDAQRRLEKQQAMARMLPEEVTFRPQRIAAHYPPGSRALSRSHQGVLQPADGDSTAAGHRLYAQWGQRQQKLEAARRQAEGPVDPATGRRRFRPATGRDPAFGRNYAHLPVGEYLYLQGVEASMRREEEARSLTAAQQQEAARSKMTAASGVMLQRLKSRRFKAIFEYLDNAHTGVVDLPLLTSQESVMQSLEPAVRDDVARAAALVAAKAAAGGDGVVLLDLPAFRSLMEEVLTRHRGPRAYLVPTPTPKHVEDGCTFRPSILRKSLEMVGARQNFRRVHDALYAAAEERARQHAHRRDEAEAARLAACTFQPTLNQRRLPAEGRALRMTEALIATGIPDIDAYEQLRASAQGTLEYTKGDPGICAAEPAMPDRQSHGRLQQQQQQQSGASGGGLSAADVDLEVERVLGRLLGGPSTETVWVQDTEGDVVVCFGSPAGEGGRAKEGTSVQ